MNKLSYDTIQLLTNIISVKHLLYTYVNIMQRIDDSFSDFFTIIYVTDIAFRLTLNNIFIMSHKCDSIHTITLSIKICLHSPKHPPQ